MEKELNLLSWPSDISPLTLDDFRASTGVRVELIDSAEELIWQMHTSGSPVDVLIPPSGAVRTLNAEGRLMSLDHARLN